MAVKVRCDCCKHSFPVEDCIKIYDYKMTSWYRCPSCVKIYGEEPRTDGYYSELYKESITGAYCQFGRADYNEPQDVVYEDDELLFGKKDTGRLVCKDKEVD